MCFVTMKSKTKKKEIEQNNFKNKRIKVMLD